MNPKLPFIVTCLICTFLAQTTADAENPKLQQSRIKGLLVIQLPNASFAGTATQMNATVFPIDQNLGRTFGVRFNQEVGPMMSSATQEVEKWMRIRHGEQLPKGYGIEYGFADKHTLKDGPSAAVACALMAESIISGQSLDDSFAVTGDITATGEVGPVGGIGAKIRGAANKNCGIMAVPMGNKSAVHDLYVMEGIQIIAATQIILIRTFEDAWQIARLRRDAPIQQAMDDYAMVQAAIAKSAANASHPKVREKLKSILDTLPHHESARLIALHGIGKAPKKLSLAGSLQSIEEAATELGNTMQNGNYLERGTNDRLWANVSKLNLLRDDVDPRTKGYLDSFLTTASLVKDFRNSGKKSMSGEEQRKFIEALNRIQSERNKITNDTKIQEELMNQG
ncbi:MAG: hypothetical protein RL346_1653 [Verrucomicrobiota bacterium]